MFAIYVARSPALSQWGGEVGLTKHLFLIGLAEGSAKDIAAALNSSACAGRSDWRVIKAESIDGGDLETMIANLARKERLVEPNLYPQVRGVRGVFKVRPENVENHIILGRALAGEADSAAKITPADVADYLMHHARPGTG